MAYRLTGVQEDWSAGRLSIYCQLGLFHLNTCTRMHVKIEKKIACHVCTYICYNIFVRNLYICICCSGSRVMLRVFQFTRCVYNVWLLAIHWFFFVFCLLVCCLSYYCCFCIRYYAFLLPLSRWDLCLRSYSKNSLRCCQHFAMTSKFVR